MRERERETEGEPEGRRVKDGGREGGGWREARKVAKEGEVRRGRVRKRRTEGRLSGRER